VLRRSEPPEEEPRFTHGVASFDPLADRVLLWTLVNGGGPVRWVVAARPDMTGVVASGEVRADPEPGTVTVDVTGLEPASTYWYRFEAAGELSPTGRTRTLGAGDADRIRIGVTCCARYSASTFAVYRAMAAADIDLVLHLGDYVYEDVKSGLPGREPDPPHQAVTLDDYRTRQAQARLDPDLQALHAAHPMVVLWDDHDFADNTHRDGAKSHDPETQGPWSERLGAALRANQDFLPKRLADPDDLASAWRSFDVGSVARIVCTETRVAGRDVQAGLEGAVPADDPERSLLGDEQRRWLDSVVDDEPAWVLLASGTVVSHLTVEAPEALDGAMPEKYAIVNGRATNTDQWDGYQAEQGRLIDLLGRRGRGSVLLSGDIHSAWALEGPIDAHGNPVAVELVCPPAATKPLGQLVPGIGPVLQKVFGTLPHFRWVDPDHHGFLTLDVARDRLVATFWWVDPAGDGAATRARGFQVLPTGRPQLHNVPADEIQPFEAERHRTARLTRVLSGVAAGFAVAAVVRSQRRR
jgi:alkaline phosphatase D